MGKLNFVMAVILVTTIFVGCDDSSNFEKNCLYELTSNAGSQYNKRGYCEIDKAGQILRYSHFKNAAVVDFIVNKQEKTMKNSSTASGTQEQEKIEVVHNTDPKQWVVSKQDTMGNVHSIAIFTLGSEQDIKVKKRFKATVKRNKRGNPIVTLIRTSTEKKTVLMNTQAQVALPST